MEQKPSIINQIVVFGLSSLSRDYTKEERDAIREELMSEALREHEKLKAEGRLDEIEIDPEYEEELPEWTEDDIEEDNAETEELLNTVFYGDNVA